MGADGTGTEWLRVEDGNRREKADTRGGGEIFVGGGAAQNIQLRKTFRLGHYGFHVCVYSSRPSCNISFSWIFNFFLGRFSLEILFFFGLKSEELAASHALFS